MNYEALLLDTIQERLLATGILQKSELPSLLSESTALLPYTFWRTLPAEIRDAIPITTIFNLCCVSAFKTVAMGINTSTEVGSLTKKSLIEYADVLFIETFLDYLETPQQITPIPSPYSEQ